MEVQQTSLLFVDANTAVGRWRSLLCIVEPSRNKWGPDYSAGRERLSTKLEYDERGQERRSLVNQAMPDLT